MEKSKTISKKMISLVLSLLMVLSCFSGMGLTAYAGEASPYADLENTTTVITFDNKQWYLIEDNSTSATEGTVTLLSKDCVAASIFGGSSTYSGSTVEGVVNNYYTNSISTDAKAAVDGNGMFLLTTDQANAIQQSQNGLNVLKCNQYDVTVYNAWWLCSQGYGSYMVAYVDGNSGDVDGDGGDVDSTIGVRPALKLDLSKVEFDSETKTFALPAPAPTSTVSFTKVTSADEITAENIGTCAAEDAKSWAIANWDDLLGGSFFAEIAFYSRTGELYFVQLYSGLDEESFPTYFDTLVDTASISNLQEWFADGHSVFICTPAAPAEDGPLVGTVIKVGDTLTLDGDYTEVMPGVIDQATDSFKLERMEYDNYFNGWGAVFEEAYAFLIAGDETPEPDGFYVSGGNGTQSHPYTLALHYAPSAYADLENTTTVITFDNKQWYLIEDNSTSATEGTVTLLSKECVGASVFDGNQSTSYSGSTIETFVNNWYSDNVTADAKSAVSGGMFLLEADIANELIEDVLKCSWEDYYGDNLWWLSTPVEAGENDRYVAFVKDGVVKADGSGMSVYVELGVRPALKLDLSKVEFDSETKTFALPAPSAYAGYVPAEADDADALAAKVVKFNGMDWYLIEDNSTSETEGTVTLFAKECVGASEFGTNNNTYSGSTVETYVNNWYTSNISADAKAAVDGNGMFLLTADQARALSSGVRKCSEASGADTNLWWLCTPFSYYLEVMSVDGDYGVVRDGVDDGTNVKNTLGVRPALKLDLSKVGFNSETKTFAVPHIHDDITFTAWTSTNSLPTDGGNYYLTNDVKLDNTWYAPNSAINLCLDGHSITAAEGKEIQLMDVENGATLNLYDKEDNSGSISGAVSVNGAILVNSGTFNMYGGTIKDNMTTDHGAGVRVLSGGTFSLYGGSIENNKTKSTTGGCGGGVHVETNSTFNMSGGSIKNNTAAGGAGVFIGSNCTFNLSGGSITGNIATNGEGGGVSFTSDSNSPATFKLSGNPTVTDNIFKFDDDQANFHISSPSNVALTDNLKIEVVGALTGDGKISISKELPGVFTKSSNSVKASDYIYKFTTDSRMNRIKTEGDELRIESPHLVIGGTFVYDDNAADVFGDGKVKFTPASDENSNAKLTLNGYQYDGTEVSEREGIVYFDNIPLDIVLKGENTIKVDNAPGIMINAPANTVISSDNGGSLEVVSEQGDAIYVNGALTVESGTISATGGNRGIAANGINLGGGKIVAKGTGERGYGIYCESLPWLPASSVSINSGITSLIASGTLGAVYGSVANELEGLGWSNITGTDGQETIAVTAEARSLEYKMVSFVSHTHSFTYSASGATITATCANTDGGCMLTDNKATLTIAAPENLTYDTNAKAAVITDANAIQGTAKVQYQTKSGSTYGEATETAPTNAGTYKASITLGGATASVEYTIAKADPTCVAPTGVTATYGQTLADVTLTNPEGNTAGTWAWADSRTSVGNVVTPAATFKASFVPTDTTNYNTKTNIDVSVKVAKKEVTVSDIKANNKVYDGSCNATIDTSRATISGALLGDTLTFSADASFADKNVGEDKTVNLSNITLGGESASNYTLASSGQQETTTASITPKEVTISGITANNKVYDGTTAATINDTSATIQGMVIGDDLSIYTDFASGNFADKNVGNNKTVTISSLLLTGYDAANYTVGSVTVTANITAKEVGLEWSNTELTYNGKAQKPTATATGLAGQDTCTVTVVGEQTNAGDNYTATAQSLSNSNYKLPEKKTTAFKINKASQTAPAAPTEAGKTVNSITLNTIPNGEYKCGAGDWQTSPTFTGLEQNKTYTFRQRYAADANHNASTGSEEAVIRTANHEHSFTYSSSNGTITATCNGAGTCSLTDNKVSFTLTAPTNLVYDGTDKKATLDGVDAFNAATGLNVSANDIVYNYKAKSSDSAVVVTETKNAGIYQALYTLQTGSSGPVADITFTVAKANPTYEAPTGLYATYGDTLADVTLPDGWAWVDDTTSVGDAGTKTFKANYTPADTTNYNTVENVDVTVKVNPADITPTVTLDGWTYGDEANTPSVTGNAGNGDVAYTYAQKGSDEFSSDVPTDAGDYTVKAVIAETANYNGGEATADFTIAKAKVTITADDKSSKREAKLKKLTYKVDGKIYDGDDLGIKVSSNAKAAVAGKYVIKVTYIENANYDVTTVNGTYTVTDRITANERTKGKNKINSAVKATVNKNGSVTAKWGAVANADKFEIYANYCSKDNEFKKIKTVKGSVHSFDITKLHGKKLDQKKAVKIYVVAYRKVNGKYEKITRSISLHVVGKKDTKSSNAKAIKVKKDAFTLKVNKTATIKPTLVLKNSKKKAVEHVAKFRYQSTNTAVATVDKNGKIKAVGKGNCTIYIFANNGKLKSVKVTVK